MKVRIKDLEDFTAGVFGADCFLKQFPEIQTTGVPVQRMLSEGWYYIINPETGWMVSDSAFFTEEEMQYLEQID